MSQMPVEANVVLTADNTQYDASMQASANQTAALGKAVDTLTDKISRTTKAAGKGMLGVAAVDVAGITAATAAWASYESQMSRLNAQSAILSRNQEQQKRTFTAYTASVNAMRATYGTTTREASALVETISKLTQSRSQRDLTSLSKVFTDMSKATGEPSSGLAASLLNLQKVMGTQIGGGTTRKYADQVTYLSQQTSMSAQGLTDFAAQIAPIGRMLNLTQTEIMGVTTAFSQAGQDGYQAATAFNKIVSDISYATQSGSPELAKYANLVGMTMGQFKEMEGSEKILTIFDRLNSMGPRAITELNRLGLDGMRTMRAITAMANQSGGLRSGILQAEQGLTSDSAATGAQKAMEGMSDEWSKIRQEIERSAEVFAERFGPAITKALQGVEAMASGFRKMMEGPLGDVAQLVATIGGTLAGVGGTLLSFAGPLAQLATAALLIRGSGARGLTAGFRGGSTIGPGAPIVPGGQPASWLQRYMYNAGVAGGAGAQSIASNTRSFFGMTNQTPLWQRGLAGGLTATGWAARNLGAPIFSPLGMAGWRDPAMRQRMFTDTRAPWTQMHTAFSDRWQGGKEFRGGTPDPNAAGTAASTARTALVAREATLLSGAFATATRGVGAFAGAMASAAANTMWLAGKGAGKLAAMGATNPAVLGAGLMLGGSAMGVDSNALTFGSMGLMFGTPALGAAGAAVGLGFDTVKQYEDFEQTKLMFNESMKKGIPSEIAQSSDAAGEELARMNQAYSGWWTDTPMDVWAPYLGSPSQMMDRAKFALEGVMTGTNPYEARVEEAERVEGEKQDVMGAFTAIAATQGTPIDEFDMRSGSASWRQLDAVLQRIQPQMDELKITSEDIVLAWAEGGDTWTEMLEKITEPGQFTGLNDRLAAVNQTGADFVNNPLVQQALLLPEDINAQYLAINSEMANSLRSGMNFRQIARQRSDVMATAVMGPEYDLNAAVLSQAQQALAYQQPFMSRTAGFRQQSGLFADQIKGMSGRPDQVEAMNAQMNMFVQATGEQVQHFQQLLTQQREFRISQERGEEDFQTQRERMEYQFQLGRERAEYDFNLSRKYADFDFNLSRERAEFEYQLSRERGRENFYRQMNRSERSFQISRNRQERDHQHQIVLMTEQSAQTMLNIYQRTEIQRTSSGGWLAFNAQEQLQQMRGQSRDLDQLRDMGLSTAAIRQLGFTDPKNAQQLDRFVADAVADPRLIKEMNEAINKRLKAARNLVTDESSREWREFERQYRISSNRAQADFERNVRQARKDFQIQMNQMEEDFRRSMSQQLEDYERAQDRQNKAFDLSMDRAAEDYDTTVDNMVSDFAKSMNRAQDDINRMSKNISGTMVEILEKATKKLHGEGRKQAAEVLNVLEDLEGKLGNKGVDIMMMMSRIFGFKYTAPKNTWSPTSQGSRDHPTGGPGGLADGGVLPGRSIGRDNMHFYSPEHGKLSLAGGEAIMVPEWVDAIGGPVKVKEMNNAARTRSFHSGGVNPLPGGQATNDHGAGYYGSSYAADYNKGSGYDDYGAPVVAWKRGRVTTAVMRGDDGSYGNQVVVDHGGSWSRYAHLSKIVVDLQQMVAQGQKVGEVGDVGNTGTPPTSHLHFEIHGGGSAPAGGGGTSGGGLAAILKASYPAVEKAAERLMLGGGDGTFPKNFWSKQINERARKVAEKFGGVAALAGGLAGGNFASAPSNPSGNVALGKRMAANWGWTGNQWDALYNLWMGESGWRTNADNPTSAAYGIPQAMTSIHDMPPGYFTNPAVQIRWGLNYIKGAYGSPASAYNQWQGRDPHWYGKGSVFTGPNTIGVGERGPEMVLPLNEMGAGFIADIFRKSQVGQEGRMQNVQHSMPSANTINYQYQIDRSTTFSGAITVQANDPNQFVNQLRQRERARALVQPAIGGSRV